AGRRKNADDGVGEVEVDVSARVVALSRVRGAVGEVEGVTGSKSALARGRGADDDLEGGLEDAAGGEGPGLAGLGLKLREELGVGRKDGEALVAVSELHGDGEGQWEALGDLAVLGPLDGPARRAGVEDAVEDRAEGVAVAADEQVHVPA